MKPDTDDHKLEPGESARRVLCVDDEKPICDALSRTLEAVGYEVRSTNHPTEALQILRDWEPAVAIVDYRLPGMNGVELFQRVKAQWPKIQRVLPAYWSCRMPDVYYLAKLRTRHCADFSPAQVHSQKHS